MRGACRRPACSTRSTNHPSPHSGHSDQTSASLYAYAEDSPPQGRRRHVMAAMSNHQFGAIPTQEEEESIPEKNVESRHSAGSLSNGRPGPSNFEVRKRPQVESLAGALPSPRSRSMPLKAGLLDSLGLGAHPMMRPHSSSS